MTEKNRSTGLILRTMAFVVMGLILLTGLAGAYSNPLDVPFKSQVPPGTWSETKNCGQTSSLMIYSFYDGTIPTDQGIKDIDDWLFQEYGSSQAINDYNGSNTDIAILETLAIEYGGFPNSYKASGWTVARVKQEIDAGHPVIVAVTGAPLGQSYGGHFLVAKGYTATGIITNDPGRTNGVITYDNTQFSNAMNSQGGAVVVVIKKSIPIQPKLDLIFLVDTTGSMWDDIDAVKVSANEIVEALNSEGLDYRVAIADYRDYPKLPYGGSSDYVYNLDLPFSNDKDSIISAINGLSLGWGADEPESVYSALVHSMEDPDKDPVNSANSGWRNGVTKAIIIMGDAPPHIPEPWSGGHTLADVISTSESIDPVIVYSIIIGSSESAYDAFAEISEGTNGNVYTSPTANDVVAAILEAIGDISEPPENRGVIVSITPESAETTAGNFASYSVNITNFGNIADEYNISLELKNFGFQRGYPATIQPSWVIFNSTQITIDPGMSEIRPLEINVPQNWAGMEDVVYTFNVTAISTTDTSIGNTSSAELKVKADKISMVEYSKLEIQWLSELTDSSGIDSGIKSALLAKLTNVETKVDQAIISTDDDKQFGNNLNTAQNMMNAFINQVNAQYNKKIMQPDAETLKEKANQILQDLETAKNS
ncbi:MAG: C39 family peptidase [Patescibacteria group bacterium]|nr:C39 family peptidase [Patescibacteria group bacterium]